MPSFQLKKQQSSAVPAAFLLPPQPDDDDSAPPAEASASIRPGFAWSAATAAAALRAAERGEPAPKPPQIDAPSYMWMEGGDMKMFNVLELNVRALIRNSAEAGPMRFDLYGYRSQVAQAHAQLDLWLPPRPVTLCRTVKPHRRAGPTRADLVAVPQHSHRVTAQRGPHHFFRSTSAARFCRCRDPRPGA